MTLIIQIRGTSGSGKTTAMRSFMGPLESWNPRYVIEGRRKPSYYVCNGAAVLGHYDSPCGGCDTFKGYDQLQLVVREAAVLSPKIVMEGLMLSDDVRQTDRIHKEVGAVVVFYLTTPLDVCIARVKGRRAEKGKDDVFNEEKLRNRAAQIERTRPRLEELGITCRRCSVSQVPRLLTMALKG